MKFLDQPQTVLIMRKMIDIEPYDGGDTGLLNAIYPEWFESGVRLPYTFNS